MRGKERTATDTRNCGTCQKYLTCSDKKKSIKYRCSLFGSIGERKKVKSTKPKRKTVHSIIPDIKVNDYSEKSEKYFTKRMEKVISEMSNNPIPPDLIIDDRDFPQAPNFYTWATGSQYLGLEEGITPFAKQLQIGTNLFSEYCPYCSNKKYFDYEPRLHLEMPVKMSPKRFFENIQLLNHGICPKCKRTKSEMYKEKKLPLYTELTGVAGQRGSKCVLPNTIVHTDKGFVPIEQVIGRPANRPGIEEYQGRYRIVDHDGRIYNILRTYVSEPDTVREITLLNGFSVTGTDVHPLYTLEKFVKIEDLRVGMPVKVFFGQNIWPEISKIDVSTAICLAILQGRPSLIEQGISLIKKPDYYNFLVQNIIRFAKGETFSFVKGEQEDDLRANHQHVGMNTSHIDRLKQYVQGNGVPSVIMTASLNVVTKYLKTLFTLIGQGFSQGIFIEEHPQFLQHVGVLLHNLGIPCQIVNIEEQSKLVIAGRSALRLFFSTVGLLSSTVEERIKQHIASNIGGLNTKSVGGSAWYEWVPLQLLEKYIDKLGQWLKNPLRSKVALRCIEYLKANGDDDEIESLLDLMLDPTVAWTSIMKRQKLPEKHITYDITVENVEQFMGNGMLNHNSTTFAMLCTYQVHGFMKLQNAARYFGLMSNTILAGFLTALTWAGAIELLWEPILTHMRDSPWYCLAAGTKVSMGNGEKVNIEDVKIGDLVATLNDNQVVTHVHDNGIKQCSKVITENGEMIGTDDHVVFCLSQDGNSIVEKRICDVLPGDYIVCEENKM